MRSAALTERHRQAWLGHEKREGDSPDRIRLGEAPLAAGFEGASDPLAHGIKPPTAAAIPYTEMMGMA
ncbi:hypothetical protein BUE93_22200 [Chromobacterium amazonense]|uniref:Uncharacterized protein n=1 Tax=Chromobacterium amazonense TaxID=1382803 RepID=A0A2S9WYH5_9NEIS|nr:hypothetical protein BUE93_22200 [Chromobacterium amazonense]